MRSQATHTSRRTRASRLVGALAAFALVVVPGSLIGAPTAHADETIACELIEVSATSTTKPEVDPALDTISKKLKKPPFSSWNNFKVLSKHSLTLSQRKAQTLKLTKGQTSVLFREVSRDPTKKVRLGLTMSMDNVKGKRVFDTKLNVDAGDLIVLGGPMSDGEGLLLALSCRLPQ